VAFSSSAGLSLSSYGRFMPLLGGEGVKGLLCGGVSLDIRLVVCGQHIETKKKTE